jgi:hypothetical protein
MNPSNEAKETFSQYEGLLVGLARAGVDFAVVGGLAVILNGHPRLTQDVDILVDESPENIRRLLGYLVNWGEGWARELHPDEFSPQEGCVRISEDFDLDVFVRMRGRSLRDFGNELRTFEAQGVWLRYLSPSGLVELKDGSWREKDRLDVLAMREILRRQEDVGGGGAP